MTATTDLLDFAAAPHVLGPQARADTARLLSDTLAVGAAGRGAVGEAAVLDVASSSGGGGNGRLLGEDRHLNAASAAFVNGYRIHCLEWDAVHEGALVHALSVVTAALGAAIDRRGGCDPEEALVALAVGVDISCGLGLAADNALTFFRPATAGVIGAALAVARIESVSREKLNDVLGLAYSSCAGTMQAHVEGSVALPFQVAAAARAAVVAVDLVCAGLTGPHDVLEGQFGYFTLFERGNLSRYTSDLGKIWRIGEMSIKPFPSGRASHGVLGALQHRLAFEGSQQREMLIQGLNARLEAVVPSDVTSASLSCYLKSKKQRIYAFVPPLVHRLVGRPMHPKMTPAHARLCLPFLVALMLTDGAIDPRRFVPEAFADPELLAIADYVHVVVDGNRDPNALSPQRLVITSADESVEEQLIANTLGSPGAPLSLAQVETKRALARDLAGTVADPRLFADPLSYFTKPV